MHPQKGHKPGEVYSSLLIPFDFHSFGSSLEWGSAAGCFGRRSGQTFSTLPASQQYSDNDLVVGIGTKASCRIHTALGPSCLKYRSNSIPTLRTALRERRRRPITSVSLAPSKYLLNNCLILSPSTRVAATGYQITSPCSTGEVVPPVPVQVLYQPRS